MAEKSKTGSESILYRTEDGQTRLEVRLEGETVWLTQNQMAELFRTTKQNVGSHIQNLFTERELREDSVVKEFFTTAADGGASHLYRSADILVRPSVDCAVGADKNVRAPHEGLRGLVKGGTRPADGLTGRIRRRRARFHP